MVGFIEEDIQEVDITETALAQAFSAFAPDLGTANFEGITVEGKRLIFNFKSSTQNKSANGFLYDVVLAKRLIFEGDTVAKILSQSIPEIPKEMSILSFAVDDSVQPKVFFVKLQSKSTPQGS